MSETPVTPPTNELRETRFVDPAAMQQFNDLVADWQARAAEKHASPQQHPEIVDEGLGLRFAEVSVYHGGAQADIVDFNRSVDTTIGAGLYATSMPDQAFGYAVIRAHDHEEGGPRIQTRNGVVEPTNRPVVYELTLQDVTFADLREQANIDRVLPGPFADFLATWIDEHQEAIDNDRYHVAREGMTQALAQLRATDSVQPGQIKTALGNYYMVGEAFSDYLISLGYDGLIGLEGGEQIGTAESYTGSHDSWVLFSPASADVTAQVAFDTPEMIDQAAVDHNTAMHAARKAEGKEWWEQ
jgi:hypothetical protein